MTMPETAMDEYSLQATGKNNIWFASQLPRMKPVAIAFGPQPIAYKKFRLGILASDPGHIIAARLAWHGAPNIHTI